MTMHSLPHPGQLLRNDVIDALGLTVSEAARRLAMSRGAFFRVLKAKARLRPDLAVDARQMRAIGWRRMTAGE